jgi:RNA polymerase sigma-70 factor (ECF subfamily)
MERPHDRFMRSFVKNQPALAGYLMAATRDVNAADDLLQEVSVVLWEKFHEYDESRPFLGWAIGVARLQVLKWRQEAARSRVVLSGEALDLLADAAVEAAPDMSEQRARLGRCLGRLRDRTRSVLRMRYYDMRSARDIAEAERLTLAAVENLLVRARRALRECVERGRQGLLGA